ncbi:Mrp/NBP35 family ATP-binding protein [Brevibacillus fulvus]|uniref:Iron-sulfur cluster carrier protein n=1 Tax=Brevibacillus fulvus TaxID=1125967 RepID=A0A939BTX9_9BACL|nr:Mrp/NBP35 family ATP-binding protein [Brevibacillus fulvus]MBM7591978.1 ATP-binding protein involved in chromosome partitioning [Brevibacillus fulvus]
MITKERVLEVLRDVKDPEINRSLVELNMIRDIEIVGDKVSLLVVLTISGCPLRAKIEQDVTEALKKLGAKEVELRMGSMTDEERAALSAQLRGGQAAKAATGQMQPLNPILSKESPTRFIAITSGKGGVGKSTVTVNLAVALARLGKKVGIIDADIYGFSVPDMMNIEQRPTVIGEVILPIEQFGVKVMSMGFFVEDNSPIIWRGPMLGKMLRNFFSEVHWGEDLDYMILDLPPGTGDMALDVHTMIPQSKEIVVTTPHATAAFVAARAGAMAIRTGHELLGVVENMSWYEAKDGSKEYVFGRGGGAKLAEQLATELLAQVPLGQPDNHPAEPDYSPSVYKEQSPIGQIYRELAERVIAKCESTVSK